MTLENEEAVSRINDLADRIPQPQFCYTHEWHAGDLLRWDHCLVPHLATFDSGLVINQAALNSGLMPFPTGRLCSC